MDLRGKLTDLDLEEVKNLILKNDLSYQPYIFSDSLETGAGQRMQDGMEKYKGENKGGRIYWNGAPLDIKERLKDKMVDNQDHFRKCNSEYRKMNDYFIDSVINVLGGNISKYSFAELGCNSGYFLHCLALRGAAKCIGYDVGPFEDVFSFFNRILNIKNEFHYSDWDPSTHNTSGMPLSEVDVFWSSAVTCHVSNPIEHITHLCDHSRVGIFLWVPKNNVEDNAITYGNPGELSNRFSWPFNLDKDVKLSAPLVKMILKESGFGDIHEIDCPDNLSDSWKSIFSSSMCCFAFRDRDIKSALYLRDHPKSNPDESKAILRKEGYKGFNILFFEKIFYGLLQTEGRFDIKKVGQDDYKCFVGRSMAETEHFIDQWIKDNS